MTRTTMSSAMPAERAEVLSDNERPYDDFEEHFIAHRSDELLAERLNDRALYLDLLAGIEPNDINIPLHRAVLNLRQARKGELVGLFALLAAMTAIENRLIDEAQTMWADECRAEAERQLGEQS